MKVKIIEELKYIDKEKDSIEGSPWGAPTTTIIQWKE